jgi:hypothetical protein
VICSGLPGSSHTHEFCRGWLLLLLLLPPQIENYRPTYDKKQDGAGDPDRNRHHTRWLARLRRERAD